MKPFSRVEKFAGTVILLIALACFLPGCADLAQQSPGQGSLSIIKLGAEGSYNPFISTSVGGYRVDFSGDTSGFTGHYEDGGTKFDIIGRKIDPADPRNQKDEK